MFIAWMREDYGVELTLDDIGLRQADQLADRLQRTSGERRRAIEQGLGEFVAAVLKEKHGGTWDPASGTLTIPGAPGQNVAGWAIKRLPYGRQDSLVAKAIVAAELARPTPEPDWDPMWPEDVEAADDLTTALSGIGEADRRPVDAALVEWLRLRKSTYLDWHPGRNADDDALDELRRASAP